MIETSLARSQRALSNLINLAIDNHVYELGEVIRICPGRTHAWYQSKIGPIKKPIVSMEDKSKWGSVFKYTIWEKIVLFVKSLFKRR